MNELDLISQFRESHHAIARMFAAGMTASMIQRKTGVSHRRLSILWGSPTFRDLVAVYVRKITELEIEEAAEWNDLGKRSLILAESMLIDKIEAAQDVGEFLPTRELVSIVADRADRLGYSKHSQVTVKHDFAAMLDKAIARSNTVRTIESKAVEVPSLPNVPNETQPLAPAQAQPEESPSLVGPPIDTRKGRPPHSGVAGEEAPTPPPLPNSRAPNMVSILRRRKVA